jgi:ATP-dependent Lon protease
MKIFYPDRNASKEAIEEILRFAMEGRKRVKGEIQKIDKTFDPVEFSYTDKATGEVKVVRTAEELRYPKFFEQYEPNIRTELEGQETGLSTPSTGEASSTAGETVPVSGEAADENPKNEPKVTHFTIAENQTGISYYKLFADYLRGAHKIEVTDPYIRRVWQIRNFVEFIQVVLAVKEEGDEVDLHLITDNGESSKMELEQHFDKIQDSLINVDVNFSWEIVSGKKLHARSITTDTGWKISLDRGLDIFQRFDSGIFSIESVSQEARYCKAFEITYLRNG